MLKAKVLIKRLSLFGVVFFIASLVYAQDFGDAIVSGSIADPRTLVPILASDSASSDVTGMMFNGLVKYDKNINLVGDLASGWDIEDGGLGIVFHLRDNVFWHDGAPFTSADVEFTYQKLIDPDVRTPYSSDFERIKSLQVIDDHTVKVNYKEPFAPGLSSWGMPIIPKHLLEKEDLNTTGFARNPVGTGPYKFKLWQTQEKVELLSNHAYFEKRPYIDRYIFRVIPDEATLFLELETRGIDSSGLSPLQYTRQTDSAFFRKFYQKFRLPAFGYTYLGYNLNSDKFRDKAVRKALNYAVSKDEIIKIILLGLGEASTGPFVRQSWAFNDKVKAAPFDPAKARALLKEAGWFDRDKDGWIENSAGKEFEFTIATNQGNEERIKVAQIIQGRLKDIGIKVKIKVVEWSVFLTEFIDKRNFDAVLLGWALGREPDNFDIWHSSKTREGEFNFIGFRNPEVDRLLEEGRRTFDQEKRKAYYQKIHEIIYEEQPYMFLYVPDGLSILSSRFKGVKLEPIGIGYNLIDWWVPKTEQRYKEVIQK